MAASNDKIRYGVVGEKSDGIYFERMCLDGTKRKFMAVYMEESLAEKHFGGKEVVECIENDEIGYAVQWLGEGFRQIFYRPYPDGEPVPTSGIYRTYESAAAHAERFGYGNFVIECYWNGFVSSSPLLAGHTRSFTDIYSSYVSSLSK